EIVEKLGRLCAGRAAVFDQLVEARAVSIEELLVVAHLDAQRESVLEMTVEVDEMRIDVVEQRTPGLQTQCNGEAAAERFDVPPRCVSLPDRREMRDQPAFAAGPFQRRFDRFLRKDRKSVV